MKKALLINSLADGGAEKVVKTIVESLNGDGIGVHLICLEPETSYIIDSQISVTFLSGNSPKNGILKLLYLPIFAFRLSRYLKREGIGLIQSHLFRANYVNIVSKILFNRRVQCQIVNHGVISRYKNEGMLGSVNLFLIRLLYPRADKVVSVSRVVESDMNNLFKWSRRCVINNPIDLGLIKKTRSDKIDDFVFEENKKYVIAVGRLITLKRYGDLIRALGGLDDCIELIFVGDGPDRSRLRNIAIKFKIAERVHFLGRVENPYKYMSKADLLVSTSETESFGNTLVEAMACGIPVVATRCGGPEEIIGDNESGLLVDIGDIATLKSSILMLLEDEEIRSNFIKAGHLRARDFEKDKIVNKYKQLLGISCD